MTEQHLTPWFPGSKKPYRVGVYQRDYGSAIGERYCWFDGFVWGTAQFSPNRVLEVKNQFRDSLQQYLPWRGVLK